MIDYHIHIGQFNDVYYDAHEVFDSIEKADTDVNMIYYSSTSTCRDDVELYRIEEEIIYAQKYTSNNLVVKPYLWYIPKYAEQGFFPKSILNNFYYEGIKLHPYSRRWDLTNTKHRKALSEIFEYSAETNAPILIHTGTHIYDSANLLREYFLLYPNANPILAHSNPLKQTVELVNQFSNIKCDTACREKSDIITLRSLITDSSKIVFGSDFPITNYFTKNLFNIKKSLTEQYKFDCDRFLLSN